MADNTASFSLHGAPLDILPQNLGLSVFTNAAKEVSDQNPSDQNRFASPQKSQVHVCAYASDHIYIADAPTQRHLDIVYEYIPDEPNEIGRYEACQTDTEDFQATEDVAIAVWHRAGAQRQVRA